MVDLNLLAQNKRQVFQIFIDKEGGVTVDDCSDASRKIALQLDVEEPFSFAYDLEIGSPGIFRQLTREVDFKRFAGQRVKVKLIEPIEGEYTIHGDLIERDAEDNIAVKTDHGELRFPLAQCQKVQLNPKL